MIEIVEEQNEIIRKQSKIIDGLFSRLAMIIAPDEITELPELDAMREVAKGGKWHGICGQFTDYNR